MIIQRTIGILILLCITLLIIPNLYQQTTNGIASTTEINTEQIALNSAQIPTVPANKPRNSSTLSQKPSAKTTTTTTNKPISSAILDNVANQILNIPKLTMPNLPENKVKLPKKKPKKPLPIFITSKDGAWVVKIASLKANKPFKVSAFKQILTKKKISYSSYNHFINKTKWVRFTSLPVVNKQEAIRLRNHINKSLPKQLQIKASIIKNE